MATNVTLADVQRAMDHLERSGQKLTNRNILAITGGDTGQVGILISQAKMLRAHPGAAQAPTVPHGQASLPQYVQAVIDQAKATIEQIGHEAFAAANQTVQAERDQMQQDMAQVAQDRDDAQQESIRFRQEIDDLKKQVADRDAEISQLKSDLAAATQAKIDLQAERDQARQDLAKAQDDLKTERASATKAQQAHAEDIRKLNDQLTQQKADNATLQQTVKAQQATLAQHQQDLRAAQDTAQAKAIEAARLDAESKGLAKSEKALQAEVQRLNGLLESTGKETAQRNQELIELHDKFSRADQARQDAEKLVAMAEDARQQMAAQLADWKKRAEDAEGTIRMQDAQITGKGGKRPSAE